MTAMRINPDNVWSDSEFPFSQAVVSRKESGYILPGR